MNLAPVEAFAVVSEKATQINADHIFPTYKDAEYMAQNLREYFNEDFVIVQVTVQVAGSFY